MDIKHTDFIICEALDEPARFLGMAVDVSAPMAVLFGLSAVLNHFIVGFVLAGGWFLLVVELKRKYGESFIKVFAYRHLSVWITKYMFPKFPNSAIRYWW